MSGGESVTPDSIATELKARAKEIGFSLTGIAPAARPDTLSFLHQWLQQGQHGEMGYMERRVDAYQHPENVLPDVKSLVLVAMNYFPGGHSEKTLGRIAKYAAGNSDYHDVLRKKLKQLSAVIHDLVPGSRTRCIVDTAPLLERDFARKAGLGWFGKNTLLINKKAGSFFFLGAVLTDFELPADDMHETSHCGTCTKCLEACPTDAFNGPYDLDSRKCISYLTIELRGKPIPLELRSGMEDWIFGCDVCQDVCPWNRKASATEVADFVADNSRMRDAIKLLLLTDEEFQEEFRKTPFERPGREGIARNAAIVLGNLRDDSSIIALEHGLTDCSPIVRGACVWALGQFSNAQSREILMSHKLVESDSSVIDEIAKSLDSLGI